jgi:NAD(P)-dependent dehydrogenase (short-subunit alcohol dehydrogenase family)
MTGDGARWDEGSIPDQSGRVAVVTGANTGLGFETARALAEHGAAVVLAVRDVGKGKTAAEKIAASAPGADITLQHLDLGSLDSIRSAAEELRSRFAGIDLLINNAGVMYPPRQRTADGFELQFGTNHLGHFALTGLLFDRVMAAPHGRIVTVSSIGHRIRASIPFDDLQWEGSYDRVAAYGASKLANLLFTYELQRRLAASTSSAIAVAAHPGFSNTDLVRHLPAPLRLFQPVIGRAIAQSAARGALPTLRAATDPHVSGGQYYGPSRLFETQGHPVPVSSSRQSHDPALQQRLWTVSAELTGVVFPV